MYSTLTMFYTCRYLCQSAVGHVLREHVRSSRKESLYAAMTVYHVQRAKSVTQQVF